MSTEPYEGRIPVFTKGDRFRKARELTGLGQREFAEKIGVSHQTVTNAEKDHRAVRKITANAWSLVTGVPVEWLEDGRTPDGDGGDSLPWLDSNKQPSGQQQMRVRALHTADLFDAAA